MPPDPGDTGQRAQHLGEGPGKQVQWKSGSPCLPRGHGPTATPGAVFWGILGLSAKRAAGKFLRISLPSFQATHSSEQRRPVDAAEPEHQAQKGQ